MKKHYTHAEKEQIKRDLKNKISSQKSDIDRFNKLESLMKKNDEILKAKVDEIYYDLDIKDTPESDDTKIEREINFSEKRIYEQLRQLEVRLLEEGKINTANIENKLRMETKKVLSDLSSRLSNAERINIDNIALNIKKEISLSLVDMEKKLYIAMAEMKMEIDSRLDKLDKTVKEKNSDKTGWEAINKNDVNKENSIDNITPKSDKKISELIQNSGHTWDIKNSGLFVSSSKNKKPLSDNSSKKAYKDDSFKNELYNKLLGEAVSINNFLKKSKKINS